MGAKRSEARARVLVGVNENRVGNIYNKGRTFYDKSIPGLIHLVFKKILVVRIKIRLCMYS